MQYFLNSEGIGIIRNVITAVKSAREYLSRIDGEIGDGDHGVNMYKGFSMAEMQINNKNSFSDGNKILSQVLMMEIGGSMGPLYGTFFKCIFRGLKDKEQITARDLFIALESSLNSIKELGKAQVGDKTMIDTLSPAIDAFGSGLKNNLSFKEINLSTIEAAKRGMESTKDMVAKIGRSSRLGERSAGVLDAGAVSCFIILEAMGNSIINILKE
jgi:dihydroxyacetone kinase-like protein